MKFIPNIGCPRCGRPLEFDRDVLKRQILWRCRCGICGGCADELLTTEHLARIIERVHRKEVEMTRDKAMKMTQNVIPRYDPSSPMASDYFPPVKKPVSGLEQIKMNAPWR